MQSKSDFMQRQINHKESLLSNISRTKELYGHQNPMLRVLESWEFMLRDELFYLKESIHNQRHIDEIAK